MANKLTSVWTQQLKFTIDLEQPSANSSDKTLIHPDTIAIDWVIFNGM